MELMFLLLGLLPMAFLTDFSGDDASDDAGDDDSGNGTGTDATDQSGDVGALLPDLDDNDTDPGWDGDPDDVLTPDDGDDAPVDVPIGDGDVIDPNDTPDEEYGIDGDGSLLQQLLSEQTAATTGIGFLGTQITESADVELGDGDDVFSLPDDGIDGTGDGTLNDWDGTPLITTEEMIAVISGGDGADEINGGDDAAYLFGGAGDDTIGVGEGATAAFGGAGADLLTGSDTVADNGAATAYLDGGLGDDTIIGGDANELIEGGEHHGSRDVGDDVLSGGGGDDVLRGGFGGDILSGGDGDDVVNHLGHNEERVVAERNEFSWHIDNQADALDGGDGNDTLIFDRADTAAGGAGSDVFWLYFDHASGVDSAEVTDFVQGQDFLRISLNPDAVSGDPMVEVGPSEDGMNGIVMVNGDVVAVIEGVPGISVADLYVDVPPNVFA